ncbi:MAG: hypothetical protein ACYTF9_05315 [Planctomycetota bacterium]|jgi:hypothetical protein
MPRHRLLFVACLALPAILAGCGQRTVSTELDGVLIPDETIARLDAGPSTRELLEALIGPATSVEESADGGTVLHWRHTRHLTEHRPDPHVEIRTRHAWVDVGPDGSIRRAWVEQTDEHDDS